MRYGQDFHGGSDSKLSAYDAGDPGSIPGSGRSSGEENGNPLQYSCLENPMDKGAWQATVHGVAKSQTRLNNFAYLLTRYGYGSDNFYFKYSYAQTYLFISLAMAFKLRQFGD